jgi:hypothetical protein
MRQLRAGSRSVAALLVASLSFLSNGPSPASAGAIGSVYTNFDADKCKHEPGTEEEDYGSWECPGLGDIKVLLSASDQRMYVSFGEASDDNLALSQTLPGFNDVYKGTVEWRLDGGKPFATILRWNVMTGSDAKAATGPTTPSGQVLVVTRLGPGGTCQIGYVDARSNADANEIARQIADDKARSFRCGEDQPVTGGQLDPELAVPPEPE